MNANHSHIAISLTVSNNSTEKFTSLLQGGILLETPQQTPLGELLTALPDFDDTYIIQRIQTIFIDGLPADDLKQLLSGRETVIAISAAMPGLAGAIFRKNGVHAPLRTRKESSPEKVLSTATPLRVRLKLFNMIAAEKGAVILQTGCTISGQALEKFFLYRQPLLAHIKGFTINDQAIDLQELLPLLQSADSVHLTIREQS